MTFGACDRHPKKYLWIPILIISITYILDNQPVYKEE